MGENGVEYYTTEDVGARCIKVAGFIGEDVELVSDGLWKIR